MASSTKIAGTGANDLTRTGTLETWTDPGNITASDDTYASITLADGGLTQSEYLYASGFGFAVPVTATIDGIVGTVERKVDPAVGPSVKDALVHLVWDSMVRGDNKADTVNAWTITDTGKEYGAADDKWNATITPADVNRSDFGLVIAIDATVGEEESITAKVDAISITVHYTNADGTTGAAMLALLM